ncbi:hypothetical protein [Lentzea sp. NPDC092896]|uniref:hypothetical protein n=1 Tax=Lentzea sp. NPDC092896 TaxID=3364127 RepID=UPI00380B02A0
MRDDDLSASRWYRLTAEIELEVVDAEALRQAASAHIDAMHFVVNTERGQTQDDARAAERREVASDAVAAIGLLADPESVLDQAFIQIGSTTHWVEETERDGSAKTPVPDFASLFAPCKCNGSSCPRCDAFQLTPRSAAVLWRVLVFLADQAFDDVLAHGDTPVDHRVHWMVFDKLPLMTWKRDAIWRRQVARSFDDLAADLETGRPPLPRCLAETLLLHLAILTGEDAVEDGWAGLNGEFRSLPQHAEDFAWTVVEDFLRLDSRFRVLCSNGGAGHDDFGKLHDFYSSTWFAPSGNLQPRDPRRPFRR